MNVKFDLVRSAPMILGAAETQRNGSELRNLIGRGLAAVNVTAPRSTFAASITKQNNEAFAHSTHILLSAALHNL